MTRGQIELLRDMYGRRSLREFAESLHSEAEMHQARELPDADDYYGREEFVRGTRRWLEEWDEFQYVAEEVIDCEERAFIRVHMTGRAKASGLTLDETIFHIWTFRDGMPWRCDVIWDEERARAVVGL
jgi:hypothetical protein